MTIEGYRQFPKALLHDHLDGGLRIDTILDLASSSGYGDLPASDPESLASWFHQAESGSLEQYLKAFDHTTGVMQTAAAVDRVAYEAVLDLAADGVVYAELRFAPMLHTRRGLLPDDVIVAVWEGVVRGRAETGIVVRLIIDAIRSQPGSESVARLAERHRDHGVVGFDLAGAEAGHPADEHLAALRVAKEALLGVTIHAGEGDGPNSIFRAVTRGGADRIGHGVRITEDMVLAGGEIVKLGRLAAAVRDRRIPLEVCISSNVDTGIASDVASHPVGALARAGFVVTLNTDNRLMSRTSMSGEFAIAATHHGFTMDDFRSATVSALRAGFADWPTRSRIINEIIVPAYTG